MQQVAVEEQLLARVSDGESLGYTSVYRYFDALRFLKFDSSKEYGIEDDILWTSSARELARCGATNYRAETLSEPEKAVFRTSIFLSDASRQFLSLFCGNHAVPRSQEQFITMARPLYVINVSAKRPPDIGKGDNEWPAEKNVEISFNPESSKIIRRPTKEFLYTYRYWCLDTNIIDELNVREAERCGILKSHSYVLFPLDSTMQITSDQFLDMIYSSLGRKLKHPQVVPIPWLMYRICPKAKISVEEFKALLLQAWHKNRHLLHLERGPGGLIEGRIYSPQREYSERYGNHRYYLVVDGTIRSNLAVFPITKGG
ncbi:MAG: hypothetical protein E3J21_03580 [Anaerolineales bacterium]|nr:MAG: hypothetical protein E3J21_03580 [Anaerolineales bacterium]